VAKNWLLQTRQYLHLILVEELWQRPENCHNYLGMNTEKYINPLNAELNPICHLLVLLGAHPILHISRIRVNFSKITPLIDKQGIYTTMKFLLVKGPLQP
jgi:hypothetical protein